MKNIPKYFRRTKEVLLVFGGEEELFVTSYTDASFQTDKDDFRLQSDFVFLPQWWGSDLKEFQTRYSSIFDDKS